MLRSFMQPFPPHTQKALWALLAAAAALFLPAVILLSGARHTLEGVLPPCSLYSLTGICCPGCGGTRAVESLLRGQWLQSARYHILVPYTAVVGGLFLLCPLPCRFIRRFLLLRPVHFYLAVVLLLLQWGARLFLFLLGRPVF